MYQNWSWGSKRLMNVINEARKCRRTAIQGNKTDNCVTYFYPFISLFMSSSGCRYSSAASAILLLVCYQCWLARWASCFTNRQWKGQPSFTRQRMSLPPPHARQSVRKNLHNSSRKCQYTESMMIRYLWEDAQLPPCDWEESVESSFPENN